MGTGIVEFRQLQEVGVFSYSDIPCLKSHENGFGVVKPKMIVHSSPKKMGLSVRSGDYPWTVHGLIWGCFGLPGTDLWTEIVHVFFLHVIVWIG